MAAIEKGTNWPFSVKLYYKHRGTGGWYWIGVGLRETRIDDLSQVKYWFGKWVGHYDDGDWIPYNEEISGLYPAALPLEAGGQLVHVCKVAADHTPPFRKDDLGVLHHAWDKDVYISRTAEFKIDKPESDYW